MHLCDVFHRLVTFKDQPQKLRIPEVMLQQPAFLRSLSMLTELGEVLPSDPLFILGDDVTYTAAQALISKPISIRDSLWALRVPYPKMWVEWTEKARVEAISELGLVDENGLEVPTRFGFLVTSDETGRRGEIRYAWGHQSAINGQDFYAAVPDVSPLVIEYDFDRMADENFNAAIAIPMREGGYRNRWANSDENSAALKQMDRAFSISQFDNAKWQAVEMARSGHKTAEQFFLDIVDDIKAEQLFFIVVMMLLTARNAVEERKESRAKINKSRIKKGESPLLDHIVTKMHIDAVDRTRDTAGGGTHGKRRYHIVRGHFVVRGETIYWRRAHGRGAGSGLPGVKSRKIEVEM